jgi:protoheme IX farnesyltransferase
VWTLKSYFSLYLQLGKFRLCLLVLFTTLIGYGLGVTELDFVEFFCLLFGTLLTAMGANGLNQWWERKRDALMLRTRQRPIPSGKLSSGHALTVTLVWSLAGVLLVYIGVNPLTAYLALITLASYVLIYTPLKPYSTVEIGRAHV